MPILFKKFTTPLRWYFITCAITIFLSNESLCQSSSRFSIEIQSKCNIGLRDVRYNYNYFIGGGASGNIRLSQWLEMGLFSGIHRGIPSEMGGKIHLNRFSLGSSLTILNREKIPLGAQFGFGWNHYWARYPSTEFLGANLPASTDAFKFPMYQIGLLFALTEKLVLDLYLEHEPIFDFTLPNANHFLVVGIRYRWSKGKSDSPSTETHENAR